MASIDGGEAGKSIQSKPIQSPSNRTLQVEIDSESGYFNNIEEIRRTEYPALLDTVYLDHAGTTVQAKSVVERWANELTSNLFGNPHSFSASSQLTSRRIDDIRLEVLKFFNASPEHFEVVFVANATAGVKLVADAFRDTENGFEYACHVDSHTSLVGVRELAKLGSRSFSDLDECMAAILDDSRTHKSLHLISYPGQSNMTGDRLPIQVCGDIRHAASVHDRHIYSLFDAAGLVSTAPLDLSNAATAPDFTVLSFYKIFGFPDLGALIIRKGAEHILLRKRYFGGGTVDMVSTNDVIWHAKKESISGALEEGTLPFHNILALDHAIDFHRRLYGSMQTISRHAGHLSMLAMSCLTGLRHGNGKQVCHIYGTKKDLERGPVIAFNLLDSLGRWISPHEVEKLTIIKNIQVRTGGLCNPGGISNHLQISSTELQRSFVAGCRCGGDNDMVNDKPIGAIRISFGAMSSFSDMEKLIDFMKEYYVDRRVPNPSPLIRSVTNPRRPHFYIESLSVFPIKSCAAFKVPTDIQWQVTSKGLAWDREWCLVHEGTNVALSQKRFPRMALLHPYIDVGRRQLIISYASDEGLERRMEISLEQLPNAASNFTHCDQFSNHQSNICGQDIGVQIYTSPMINGFFSEALGVPCRLARHALDGPTRYTSMRQPSLRYGSGTDDPPMSRKAVMLSNESPILVISRSSVNKLNEDIKQRATSSANSKKARIGKTVPADCFRGNIVIAEQADTCNTVSSPPQPIAQESPYIEDTWSFISINGTRFDVLGPCQRCQMVCVDQASAQRQHEPFSTLAKTRRKDGKVWFGMHLGLASEDDGNRNEVDNICTNMARSYVKVGDLVYYQ